MKIIRSIQISFLLLLVCQACITKDKQPSVSIRWENERAKAFIIEGISSESNSSLQVRLIKEGERTSILGEYSIEDNHIIFQPIVPFTKGLNYELLLKDSIIAEIQIPKGDLSTPELIAIYPTNDTLPENLLKLYFQFSESMQEGHSLKHITLIAENQDTLRNTFLDLQPELWNADGNLLTVWLDPGRIKRGLQPNLKLGAPLVHGKQYSLIISSDWKSKAGVPLKVSIKKNFVVGKRDELSPNPNQWGISPPPSKTKDPVIIQLHESLDYALLMETIQIFDDHDNAIKGFIELDQEERNFQFIPEEFWNSGDFKIRIESRLEDLSGNNLNRLFDQDLTKINQSESSEFSEIHFSIK